MQNIKAAFVMHLLLTRHNYIWLDIKVCVLKAKNPLMAKWQMISKKPLHKVTGKIVQK